MTGDSEGAPNFAADFPDLPGDSHANLWILQPGAPENFNRIDDAREGENGESVKAVSLERLSRSRLKPVEVQGATPNQDSIIRQQGAAWVVRP